MEEGPDVCHDLLWVFGGTEKAVRKADKIKIKQSDNLLTLFAFYVCDDEGEAECLISTSDAALAPCKGSGKVNVSSGVSGGVKIKCSDGINAASDDYDLSEAELDWVNAAFPDLGTAFEVKFKDDAGERLTDEEFGGLLEGLDLDDLDDPAALAEELLGEDVPPCEA